MTIAQQKMKIRKSNLFCSSDVGTESIIDFGHRSGNFLFLLAIAENHAVNAQKIRNGLKNEKYTHNSVQNTLLEITAEEVGTATRLD